jgi:DNA invertase Pin-like site-specific DNA recombinase
VTIGAKERRKRYLSTTSPPNPSRYLNNGGWPPSLGDFAKLVEILDAKGASFVSVTRQFNTTTSIGRLTLNVLLSFAQFEREVTGERIRDKIADSKKKSMWMGGVPRLGYAARDYERE